MGIKVYGGWYCLETKRRWATIYVERRMVHGAKVIARRDVIGQLPTPGPLLAEQHVRKYTASGEHNSYYRKKKVDNSSQQRPPATGITDCARLLCVLGRVDVAVPVVVVVVAGPSLNTLAKTAGGYEFVSLPASNAEIVSDSAGQAVLNWVALYASNELGLWER